MSSGTRDQFHNLVCAHGPTFEKLFCGVRVWREAQRISVGCKTFYEIDPWCPKFEKNVFSIIDHFKYYLSKQSQCNLTILKDMK